MSAAERGPLALTAGDHVEVDIENDAPIGGRTQLATMVVTDVDGDERVVFGEDPNWGDDVEILLGAGVPHYAGSGKSGDVTEIRQMETRDGVPIAGSGTVLYDRTEDVQ